MRLMLPMRPYVTRCARYLSSAEPLCLPLDDGAGQAALVPGHGGPHDVGGIESLLGVPVDLSDPALTPWEQETHALLVILVGRGLLSTDELRRHIETMDEEHYIHRSYYCKWSISMALGLLERGVLTHSELDAALRGGPASLSNSSCRRA